MLADQIARIADQLDDVDGIVPVPIHKRKLRDRGFNQTELLATHCRGRSGYRSCPRLNASSTVVRRSGEAARIVGSQLRAHLHARIPAWFAIAD